MEFAGGSINKMHLERARKYLGTFVIEHATTDDQVVASRLMFEYRLRSGLSIIDCFIAAQAISRKATLYTFNLKHFGVIEGLDACAPYQR